MIAAELDLGLPDASVQVGKVAAILERVSDSAARDRVLALDRLLSGMERAGYEIGTPARVKPRTQYIFAEWHIPIKHAGAWCVLSFFINESFEPTHDQPRHGRAAARR